MLTSRIAKFLYPIIFALQVNLSTETMDSKALSSAVAKFSSKFCNELEKNKSVVSSPLSAEILLALLTLGSTDDVHTELLNSLELIDDDSIRSSFTSVSNKLKSIKGVTLNVANKIYVMEGPYELNEKFNEDAVNVFDAGLEKLDFNNNVGSVSVINKWVEEKTNDRIKDLLSSDSVGGDTRLVLVNAIYFKGTWKNQFDPSRTEDKPFHVDANTIVNVPMMYKEDNYFYGESAELNAQLLRISYVGDEASMIIVLPTEIDGLDSVLTKLAGGYDLMAELDRMFRTKVQVTLPKFKIETEIDLKELLPKLGINLIFDSNNTGLCNLLKSKEALFVSKAVQKAFIEVNEEGAEAAAATGMVLMMRCARPPAPLFTADRPFLYVLAAADDTPAFIGVYRGNA